MNDLLFGTVTLPKIISRYWWDDKVISFGACFTQMYFVHSLGAIHSLLLLIMALDRFIAVSLPLKYPVLITNKKFLLLVDCHGSWHFLGWLQLYFMPWPCLIVILTTLCNATVTTFQLQTWPVVIMLSLFRLLLLVHQYSVSCFRSLLFFFPIFAFS